jgi:hypothetical protein
MADLSQKKVHEQRTFLQHVGDIENIGSWCVTGVEPYTLDKMVTTGKTT